MTTKPATLIACSVTPVKSFGGALARAYLRDPLQKACDKTFRDREELKVFWDQHGLTYINDEQFLNDYNIEVHELEVEYHN